MAVAKINAAIAALDWEEVEKTPRGHVKQVCVATLDEWEAFVEVSEEQTLKSKYMEWFDGQVWIVELPTAMHSRASRELDFYVSFIPGTSEFLLPCGAAFTSTGRKLEPDESFGPDPLLMAPLGTILPPGVEKWADFATLKVEIGVTRSWSSSPGQLHWKASQWANVPGVAYVLCIILAVQEPTHLPAFTYKLYEVETTGDRLPEQVPVPIEEPSAVVTVNSRRLLGLPVDAALPPGFPGPELALDLYEALEKIFRLVRLRIY